MLLGPYYNGANALSYLQEYGQRGVLFSIQSTNVEHDQKTADGVNAKPFLKSKFYQVFFFFSIGLNMEIRNSGCWGFSAIKQLLTREAGPSA